MNEAYVGSANQGFDRTTTTSIWAVMLAEKMMLVLAAIELDV